MTVVRRTVCYTAADNAVELVEFYGFTNLVPIFLMFLTNPVALYLLLLLVPVIVLYILKVRLRRKSVSTFMFWQQVFEERRARSFWQYLRYLLSLLLSLLFLLLLIGAVLNPVLKAQAQQRRCIIVIDNSASMNALTEGGVSRLDLAKNEVLSLLKPTAVPHPTAIFTAGGSPDIACGFTNHIGTLRRNVESIAPTLQHAALKETIQLAQRLTALEEGGESDTLILVYTDGCGFSDPFPVSGSNIRYIPVGKPVDNLAITQFQPRWSLNDTAGYEILAEVAFFGMKPVTARLEVETEIDGKRQLLDVVPFTLEPNQTEKKVIQGTSMKGGMFYATLKYTDSEADDPMKQDNTVTANLPPRKTLFVDYYGEENYFLHNVLAAQPHIEWGTNDSHTNASNRVSVFYQTVPATIPQGNVLLIDPQNSCDLFEVGETLETPIVTEETTDSPLMNFVQLVNLLIPGAKQLRPRPEVPQNENLTVLAKVVNDSPIYLQWKTAEQNVVALTGNLNQSDLPLRTVFPIMVAQVLNQISGNSNEIIPSQTLGVAESNLRLASESFYQQPEWNEADFYVQGEPVWIYLACSALLLTAVEWFLFHRRWID